MKEDWPLALKTIFTRRQLFIFREEWNMIFTGYKTESANGNFLSSKKQILVKKPYFTNDNFVISEKKKKKIFISLVKKRILLVKIYFFLSWRLVKSGWFSGFNISKVIFISNSLSINRKNNIHFKCSLSTKTLHC